MAIINRLAVWVSDRLLSSRAGVDFCFPGRFSTSAYICILRRIVSTDRPGVSYWDRFWITYSNPSEPLLWRSRPIVLRLVFWVLFLSWVVLIAGAATIGPRGFVPFYPLAALAAVFPIVAILRSIRRRYSLARRGEVTVQQFVAGSGGADPLSIPVINAVRCTLAGIYATPASSIRPNDSERTLRVFAGITAPYGFELVLGAEQMLFGAAVMSEAETDRIIKRLFVEARTVADFIVVLTEEWRRELTGMVGKNGQA